MKRSVVYLGCSLLSLQLLTGCNTAGLFDSELPAPASYMLAPLPPAKAATTSRASTVDIAIARPDVGPALDTRRIAVLRGRELNYYRRTEWGGSVTDVMQALLVASLDQQQLFRSVTSEQTRVSAAYLLDVEVRDFQSEYADASANPQVRVTLVSRLIRVADRGLVATMHSTALRPANDNKMGAVAAAFEAAAQDVAQDLATKSAVAVSGDQEQPVPRKVR